MSKQNNTDHPLYNTWRKIKEKHYNINMEVTMCPRWLCSFNDFIRDVGDKPDDNYYLKRWNKLMPYNKKNVRWATKKVNTNIVSSQEVKKKYYAGTKRNKHIAVTNVNDMPKLM